MKVDGRPDNPTLSLIFECNRRKEDRNRPVSDDSNETETIKVHFRPESECTRHPGNYMMEQYQYGMLQSVDHGNTTIWDPQVIQSQEVSQVPHIGVFRFYCWDIEAPATPTGWIWQHYRDSGIDKVLDLIFRTRPVGITIWISLEKLTEQQWNGFKTFEMAFNERSTRQTQRWDSTNIEASDDE